MSPIAHSAATPGRTARPQRGGPGRAAGPAAADRVAPLAGQAADRVGPYARQAADRVSPYSPAGGQRAAASAKERGTQVAEKVGPVGPELSAVDKVTPAVEAARDKVADDLLPKLTVALSAAAGSPLVEEASNARRPPWPRPRAS